MPFRRSTHVAAPSGGEEEYVDAAALELIDEQDADVELEEAADGMPVLASVRAIEPAHPSALPAVHAAAAAATGFVAGAATLALVRRHSARKLARRQTQRGLGGLPILASRSFLVDVHVIAKPGE